MTISMQNWKLIRDALGSIVSLAVSAVGVSFVAVGAASAQSYPSKPIRSSFHWRQARRSTPWPVSAATALSSRLGQPVIVENRAGSGGTIASKAVATATPDSYTLLFVGLNHVFAPSMSKNINYDPIKDFAPVATVGTGSYTLVVAPAVPAKSVKELAAYAKANPEKLN